MRRMENSSTTKFPMAMTSGLSSRVKERDAETGYDYFGARFYWQAGTWLSVDPLAGDYPQISPYAYCAWNPISRIKVQH